MQKLPSGAIVRIRQARWRVTDVRPYDDCQLVTVTPLAPRLADERHFLAPFDIIQPIDKRVRPRRVSPRIWRRACRILAADDTPPGCLRTAARVRIDLLPHQLAPALAVVRGLGCRLLLADEVGLGKTIQAGLIVAELRARDAIERVLVLTPAGLRDQWRTELHRRFAIDAAIADAVGVRAAAATLPSGMNPWTAWPVAIASIDYVKRPEVLAAVSACRWDLVVIDEAHGAAADSDRHHATHALSARASFVLLLTATPHSGIAETFESLCDIGRVGDAGPLVFRRSRSSVGVGSRRRVHVLRVAPTRTERRMHRRLRAYIDAVAAERGDVKLAASVLQKRALSSAWSLAESVDRRLRTLDEVAPEEITQLTLPLDLQGELTDADEPPPWPSGIRLADGERDRRLLRSLAAAARGASTHESKIAALNRWLRRVAEPAIVFTEYRDTLRHVESRVDRETIVLHGGLNAAERRSALARFASRPDAVLLATDAAGEGLNLHERCRLVINLELPWNPIRLEQRVGRVDRIGQRRIVHAVLLVASGGGEVDLLQRLDERTANACAVVPIGDPIDTLTRDAADEAGRLETVRAHFAATDDRVRATLDADGSWITRPRGRWRRRVGPARLEVWRVCAEDGDGRSVASKSFAVRGTHGRSRVTDALGIVSCEWREAMQTTADAFARRRREREQAIAAVVTTATPLFQPGLFDHRRERAKLVAEAADVARHDDVAMRLARIERQRAIEFKGPERLLVAER